MVRSACIEKISCPDCPTQPNTHLQTYLNEDKALGLVWYTSFCHGDCWEQKGDPYADKVAPKAKIKTPKQLKEETAVVKSCKLFKPKNNYRGIPPKFFISWGCRLLLSEFDGKTPYAIGFPYSDYGKLCGWKAAPFKRKNGKKNMYAIGKTSNVDLWGLERALRLGGDTLWITEGEYDAIALDYCMVMVGGKKRYPVVSLTAGGGSLSKNFDYVESRIKRKYKYIVLVLDNDTVGKIAEETALELWGSMIKIVKKPKGSKDANAAVKAGQVVEMGKLALNFKR